MSDEQSSATAARFVQNYGGDDQCSSTGAARSAQDRAGEGAQAQEQAQDRGGLAQGQPPQAQIGCKGETLCHAGRPHPIGSTSSRSH